MKNKMPIMACLLLATASLTSCAQPANVKIPSNAPPVVSAQTPPQREEKLVVAYQGEDGKTALELLKAHANIRTETSQLGELVVEINGVANGNDYHLIYFVNGATAKTGAARLVTKSGDKIEWKLIGPRKQ
ncbi:MAG: DUF4430 domain-containing protein [Blastocatellales bacterium]